MSGSAAFPGTLPRKPRRMRPRVLLALALAAGAAIFLLRTLEPTAPRERSVEASRPAAPAEAAASGAPAVAPGPVLRVSVRDAEDLPVAGARCDVEPWGSSALTDDLGIASISPPAGARKSISVCVSKEGFRPASRRGRFLEKQAMKLKLLEAPEIRVFDETGQRLTNFTLEPQGADLRERKLRARGCLDLDLADLGGGLLSAWDDLLGGTPVDLYLVSDEGLARAVVRVDHPAGAKATVQMDLTLTEIPDLHPRLRALPSEWRSYYAKWWNRKRLPPCAAMGSGDEMAVYAEGTVVVTCLATDCRPLRAELHVAAGRTVERTLTLEREAWATQEIVVTDRFGREGPVAVEIVRPTRFPLAALGASVSVPRGGGPYKLRADGGPRGSAVVTVQTLPAKEPIRFELAGMEIHLKLLDDETGEPIKGLALRADGRPVEWNADESAYVFGPVDPGTVRVVHDAERTIDLRVDPAETERGVLRKELRVRGFPMGAAPEGE